MHELEKLFQQTIEDEIFTREERTELRKFVKDSQLPINAQGALRAKIFEMVETRLEDPKAIKLLAWLREANKILLPKAGSGLKQNVLFSPGNTCRNAIISHMGQCRNTMDICVFTISDDHITRKIEQCHKRGIRVRIISDDDKSLDRGSDIYRMSDRGISVKIDRTPFHMHHKFAVFDQHYVLTGSYNWTRSAADKNEENILITNDPKSIRTFSIQIQRALEHL